MYKKRGNGTGGVYQVFSLYRPFSSCLNAPQFTYLTSHPSVVGLCVHWVELQRSVVTRRWFSSMKRHKYSEKNEHLLKCMQWMYMVLFTDSLCSICVSCVFASCVKSQRLQRMSWLEHWDIHRSFGTFSPVTTNPVQCLCDVSVCLLQSCPNLSVTSSDLNPLQLLFRERAVRVVVNIGATLHEVRGLWHPNRKTMLGFLLFSILFLIILLFSIVQVKIYSSVFCIHSPSALVRFVGCHFSCTAQPLCLGLCRGTGLLLRLPAAFPLHPPVLEPDLDLPRGDRTRWDGHVERKEKKCLNRFTYIRFVVALREQK